MSNSNKIKSINKRLESIFKDTKGLPFDDIEKVLFNIELLKNKYLNRIKQNKADLYEDKEAVKLVDLKAMIKGLKEEGIIGAIEPQPYDPNRRNRRKDKG